MLSIIFPSFRYTFYSVIKPKAIPRSLSAELEFTAFANFLPSSAVKLKTMLWASSGLTLLLHNTMVHYIPFMCTTIPDDPHFWFSRCGNISFFEQIYCYHGEGTVSSWNNKKVSIWQCTYFIYYILKYNLLIHIFRRLYLTMMLSKGTLRQWFCIPNPISI
jgi:hypothetical protein